MKNENVLMRVKTLEKLIRRYMFDNRRLSNSNRFDFKIKFRPDSTQAEIIKYIIEHNDEVIYQRDLEKVLHFSKASISDVLRTMERNNLIIRNVDSNDSRNKIIKFTYQAEKIYNQNRVIMDEVEKKIMKGITPDEKEVFCRVIDKMEKNITN